MASVSVELVKYLQFASKGVNSKAPAAYISTIEKAGKMNNPDVDKILAKAYEHIKKDEWDLFGGTFTLLSSYPELRESVITANMLALDEHDFDNDDAAEHASEKDKFIAQRFCELALTDETAFDNDEQRKQHARLMKSESYRITFLNGMKTSLNMEGTPVEEKEILQRYLALAEKEYAERVVS